MELMFKPYLRWTSSFTGLICHGSQCSRLIILHQNSWLQDKQLADLFAFLPDPWPLTVGWKYEQELLLICEISLIMWRCYSLNVFLKLLDDSIIYSSGMWHHVVSVFYIDDRSSRSHWNTESIYQTQHHISEDHYLNIHWGPHISRHCNLFEIPDVHHFSSEWIFFSLRR
jgi:hypothetical protein